jgi:hypothetical protein
MKSLEMKNRWAKHWIKVKNRSHPAMHRVIESF